MTSEILEVDGRDVCRVHAEPSGHPVVAEITKVDAKGQQERTHAFFIRLSNGTREITAEREIQRYIDQRWGTGSR